MPIKPENKKLYPKNWKAIREEILDRAERRCECSGECELVHPINPDPESDRRCAVINHKRIEWDPIYPGLWDQGDEGVRIVLTIAHLNHNPKDNRRRNLKAMCQRCHNRYDRKHRQRNAALTRKRRREEG